MQIRRVTLWLSILVVGLLPLRLSGRHPWTYPLSTPLPVVISDWAWLVNAILPIAMAMLLADRFVRDRKTNLQEVFTSTSAPLSTRLFGKWVGTTLATLIPVLIPYSIGIIAAFYRWHDPQALILGGECFAAIILPGAFFVSAFSIACPVIIWIPLYDFLFIGYWFWGNMFPPNLGIPTLTYTLLTPIGSYATAGFFGWQQLPVSVSPTLAYESIGLLLGLAVLAIVALWGYVRWEQARQ